jgi:hypothetical protein
VQSRVGIKIYLFLAVCIATRAEYGLPADWRVVDRWIKFSGPVPDVPELKPQVIKKKCPEIPVLENYRSDPGEELWKKFPKSSLPEKAMSRIVISAFNAKLAENGSAMLNSEISRVGRVI